MGKSMTPTIDKKPVEIDIEKLILIVDSDEEAEPTPITKKQVPVIDVDAISIDLTEDDTPLDYTTIQPQKKAVYTPPTIETSPKKLPLQVKPPSLSPFRHSLKAKSPHFKKTIPSKSASEASPQSKRLPASSAPFKADSSQITTSNFFKANSSQSKSVITPSKTFKASKEARKRAPTPSKSSSTKIPSTSSTRIIKTTINETPSVIALNRGSLVVPEKWNSPSSLERRSSSALLSKLVSSSSEQKFSIPRSTLLKYSSSIKGTSSVLKATQISPQKSLSPLVSASLKRTIESPERPTYTSSLFGFPNIPSLPSTIRHSASSYINTSPSSPRCQSSERSQPRPVIHGPPERRQPLSIVHRSPERKPSHSVFHPVIRGSPEILPSQSMAPLSPVDNRRVKSSSSPFSSKSLRKEATKCYDIYDEDGSEEELESFISVIANTRRKAVVDNTPKPISMQCPICNLLFPKNDLINHAAECTGETGEDEDNGFAKAGQKRGIRKKTIGAAVALDESERKRFNKGKIDMGPTNYYADSESILALNSTGFNAEVTGMTWEFAGQTTFS